MANERGKSVCITCEWFIRLMVEKKRWNEGWSVSMIAYMQINLCKIWIIVILLLLSDFCSHYGNWVFDRRALN